MSNLTKEKNRYIHSLDGLRGIAVLAVIAYHMDFNWASGGLLGVTIFFVLSGYLITNLLMMEWDQTNTINLKEFWFRRARRLLPAMFSMLFIITAWVTLFEQSFLSKLREDFLAAALYVSNWWYIFQDLSYFEAMGTPSLLTHFWSLAIEEQFYIIWPIFIFVALLFKMKKKHIMITTIVIAVISALAMALLYDPNVDPSRVYYGTDTRVFSLLSGAALAFFWPSQKLAKQVPTQLRIVLDITGAAALVIIFVIIALTNQYGSFLYYGGMVLVSILSVILIATLVHPASKLSKLMSFKPLCWIGARSYGIYLWHYPIILLTSPKVDIGEFSFTRFLFQIVLILVVSSLSYTYIENPIRKGGIKKYIDRVRNKEWNTSNITNKQWIAFGCTVLILLTATFGLTLKSIHSPETVKAKEEHLITNNSSKQASSSPKKENPTINKEEQNQTDKTEPKEDPKQNVDKKVSVVGDSVMIDSAPYLKQHFPNIVIDAEIGRQMYKAAQIVEGFKSNNKLGDYLVIGLGSNGAFNSQQLKSLVQSIDSKVRIILITTRVPKPWESTVNEALKTIDQEFKNVTLIDWYKYSAGHAEYFEPDGVHLTKIGSEFYASLIASEINRNTN